MQSKKMKLNIRLSFLGNKKIIKLILNFMKLNSIKNVYLLIFGKSTLSNA